MLFNLNGRIISTLVTFLMIVGAATALAQQSDNGAPQSSNDAAPSERDAAQLDKNASQSKLPSAERSDRPVDPPGSSPTPHSDGDAAAFFRQPGVAVNRIPYQREQAYFTDLKLPSLTRGSSTDSPKEVFFDGSEVPLESTSMRFFGLQSSSPQSATAQAPAQQASGMSETEKIAIAMANPLSYLWLLFFQNDTISYNGDILETLGEDAQLQNTTLFMPVLSMQLTDKWKMIFRPVIPINSFSTVDNVNLSANNPGQITGVDLKRQSGIGDIVLWTAFSNKYTPPFVFGFGPTFMLNTATDDFLGTGKTSAGPMALAVGITEKWIFGTVAQHWWSFAGEDELTVSTDAGPVQVPRPDLSLTDMQVILRYRLSTKTNIGMAPNWRYNWETSELSLPLGGGFDTLVSLGRLPVKIGFEAYYYVEQDDRYGPTWQIRFLFVPVIPAPEWAGRPLFCAWHLRGPQGLGTVWHDPVGVHNGGDAFGRGLCHGYVRQVAP